MNNEYISISEFAKIIGLSRQAVYNKLDKELTEYVVMVDNKKMLLKTAINIYKTNNSQRLEDNGIDKTIDRFVKEIETLQNLVNSLQNQLTEKDKKIDELNKIILDNNVKFAELADKALQTASQAQYLQAQTADKKGFFRRLLHK